MLTLAVGLLGASYSGILINHLDLAPNFAGTLYGLVAGVACISSWVAPLVVATLTEAEVNESFTNPRQVTQHQFPSFSFFF
jgi:ACS family sodium-dependent inorganic phosphate cotransporter-like MFS transporter 5